MSAEWRRLDHERQQVIASHQGVGPTSLPSLARSLGLKVLAATLKPGISGEIRCGNGGQYVVKVNRHDPARRQRFTVAHEIAHFLLHKDLIGEGIEDDVLYRSALSDRFEHEANRLAAEILMSPESIQHSYRRALELNVEDVIRYIADQFDVSEAAAEIRLKVLGYEIDA